MLEGTWACLKKNAGNPQDSTGRPQKNVCNIKMVSNTKLLIFGTGAVMSEDLIFA